MKGTCKGRGRKWIWADTPLADYVKEAWAAASAAGAEQEVDLLQQWGEALGSGNMPGADPFRVGGPVEARPAIL